MSGDAPPTIRPMSRPSRARGLKLQKEWSLNLHEAVAPLAGAWIETLHHRQRGDIFLVAPLAGAWIETCAASNRLHGLRSRPSRARGLKLQIAQHEARRLGRAPRGRVD